MFDIVPNIGAIPLTFGMRPIEVSDVIGSPDEECTSALGGRYGVWKHFFVQVGYAGDSCKVNKLMFTPGACVFFKGQDLFSCDDLISYLKQSDPEPMIAVGLIFFLNLGICLSGFQEANDPQKAISVANVGHWDEYSDLFETFN